MTQAYPSLFHEVAARLQQTPLKINTSDTNNKGPQVVLLIAAKAGVPLAPTKTRHIEPTILHLTTSSTSVDSLMRFFEKAARQHFERYIQSCLKVVKNPYSETLEPVILCLALPTISVQGDSQSAVMEFKRVVFLSDADRALGFQMYPALRKYLE
jgi:hypothetical protein